ncbi:hypothetical protein CHUAL_009412 [Chamberlinius hualienensis]
MMNLKGHRLQIMILTKLTVANQLIITPHDVSMEQGHSNFFTVYTSKEPLENLTVVLELDHNNVVKLSDYEILFNNDTWHYNVTAFGENAGKVVVTAYFRNWDNDSTTDAYVRLSVPVHHYVDVLSDVFGWIYFVCWTSTFYPQMYLNFRRKSITGLSMDYIVFNLLGTGSYSIYNFAMYFGKRIQEEYFDIHPYGILQIKPQDVAFAIISFSMTGICGLQGIYYSRKSIRISNICLGIFSMGILFLLISAILGATDVISWLTCVYYVSYVKLGVTLIKYIPQVYSNYRNKSTSGWSVGYPILDFSGGFLSITQMFLMAFNYDDWNSIFGNPTKLLLGVVSMFFDTIFLVQHFIIYRKPGKKSESSTDLEVKSQE